MRPKPKNLLVILTGVALYVGWQHVDRESNEVAVMHVGSRIEGDRYARLWVVDQGQFVWIRAEDRDRYWLDFLREDPRIQLTRKGHVARYNASFFDDDQSRYQVNALFREKYGIADEARDWIADRDTLPIRLEKL